MRNMSIGPPQAQRNTRRSSVADRLEAARRNIEEAGDVLQPIGDDQGLQLAHAALQDVIECVHVLEVDRRQAASRSLLRTADRVRREVEGRPLLELVK